MDDSTPRRAALDRVGGLIPNAARPLLVAVDGPDGAGKTCFADELALLLGDRGRTVVRASVDDFHHPRAYRHALGRTAHDVWTRHFDYRALRRELIDPWLRGPGSAYRATWHDVCRDEYVDAPTTHVPDRAVLLVDGVFVQRAELRQAWDLVVFVDAPPEVTVARMAVRDGTVAEADHPDQRRYLDAQRIYADACAPRRSADIVVDNTDLTRPVLVANDPAPPRGWRAEGDYITRTIRLPIMATAVAEQIDRLAPER